MVAVPHGWLCKETAAGLGWCVVVSHASGHEIHKSPLTNILLDGRTKVA
jgi:hypothetical protein